MLGSGRVYDGESAWGLPATAGLSPDGRYRARTSGPLLVRRQAPCRPSHAPAPALRDKRERGDRQSRRPLLVRSGRFRLGHGSACFGPERSCGCAACGAERRSGAPRYPVLPASLFAAGNLENVRILWMVVIIVVVAFVVVAVVGVPFFFNWLSPRTDAQRRSRDDNYFFDACASGWMSRYRWFNRRLPAAPRCRLCLIPFAGAGRLLRVRPSRKNPNFCMGCFEMAPLGAHDMEVGVLFADIRGFTSWCEGQAAEVVERALNRFYAVSTGVLAERDAIIDKLIGDEVMGLFLTAFPSLKVTACEVMVQSAEDVLRRLEVGDRALPVGIGLSFGVARVGNLGDGPVKDFTAVGDVVNTAARLQSHASPGQIVMSEAVYQRVSDQYPGAAPVTLDLKGKSGGVRAHVLNVTSQTMVGTAQPS
jgi:adenylate cyclase